MGADLSHYTERPTFRRLAERDSLAFKDGFQRTDQQFSTRWKN
jgi:hypothetical protein